MWKEVAPDNTPVDITISPVAHLRLVSIEANRGITIAAVIDQLSLAAYQAQIHEWYEAGVRSDVARVIAIETAALNAMK